MKGPLASSGYDASPAHLPEKVKKNGFTMAVRKSVAETMAYDVSAVRNLCAP